MQRIGVTAPTAVTEVTGRVAVPGPVLLLPYSRLPRGLHRLQLNPRRDGHREPGRPLQDRLRRSCLPWSCGFRQR